MTTSVTIEKWGTKQVQCEFCKCSYVYDFSRKATRRAGGKAQAFAIHGGLIGALIGAAIDSTTHKDDFQLREEAEQAAEQRMAGAVELAPCPGCGWFQADMVKEARKRARRGRVMVALLSIGFMALIALVVMAQIENERLTHGTIPSWLLWAVGLVLVSCVTLYLMRWVQLGSYDVNAGHPLKRPPVKGAVEGRKVLGPTSMPQRVG